MVRVVRACVPRLRRLGLLRIADPARHQTAGWAKLWRACGAGELLERAIARSGRVVSRGTKGDSEQRKALLRAGEASLAVTKRRPFGAAQGKLATALHMTACINQRACTS